MADFAYPCGVAYTCTHQGDIQCAVLFQTRRIRSGEYTIKLSLIIHNGERNGKDHLFKTLLPSLLSRPGVYIEAASAVSWMLRKASTPEITNEREISGMLQLPVSQSIMMNPIHQSDSKGSQRYVHMFWSTEDGSLQYANAETMFGTFGVMHTDGSCRDVARILNIGAMYP